MAVILVPESNAIDNFSSRSSILIVNYNVCYSFIRQGSTWMHGVYSFGPQHQPFSLFPHLDSSH